MSTPNRLKSDYTKVEANAVIFNSFRLSKEIACVIVSKKSFALKEAVFQLVKLSFYRCQR